VSLTSWRFAKTERQHHKRAQNARAFAEKETKRDNKIDQVENPVTDLATEKIDGVYSDGFTCLSMTLHVQQ